MADGRKNGIPVAEAVLSHDSLFVHRFRIDSKVFALQLCIVGEHFLAFDDVVRLVLLAEPLVDAALCLGTLRNFQPVAARSF